MDKVVDVAIIGAGTAGLSALEQVRKHTDKFVIINDGPYGTTCARVGCMPSKVLLQAANVCHRAKFPHTRGLRAQVYLDISEVLKGVREQRDYFVNGALPATEKLGARSLPGRARFLDANTLQVGKQTIRAKSIIVATGSRPVVPPEWRKLRNRLLTSDTLFEQDDLPKRIAVIGMGAIGCELGQALARLGVEVTGFHRSKNIGGLSDPKVSAAALEALRKEFSIEVGKEIDPLSETRFDAFLACIGREPNLDDLGLENTGLKLDKRGVPVFDPQTMRAGKTRIFMGGDVDGDRAIQHEAADDGRIAGMNSVKRKVEKFPRKTRLAITFCEPNLGVVGTRFSELEKGIAVGEVSFATQGRSKILGENQGLLRVYAQKRTGKLLGAELAAPRGEHLAHLLAWSVMHKITAKEFLRQPFYHPVVEEGLRSAVRKLI